MDFYLLLLANLTHTAVNPWGQEAERSGATGNASIREFRSSKPKDSGFESKGVKILFFSEVGEFGNKSGEEAVLEQSALVGASDQISIGPVKVWDLSKTSSRYRALLND